MSYSRRSSPTHDDTHDRPSPRKVSISCETIDLLTELESLGVTLKEAVAIVRRHRIPTLAESVADGVIDRHWRIESDSTTGVTDVVIDDIDVSPFDREILERLGFVQQWRRKQQLVTVFSHPDDLYDEVIQAVERRRAKRDD